MSRKDKRHDAETSEGPHTSEETPEQEEDFAGEGRSKALWNRETIMSLVIMFALLAGLGAALYFRLSPESVGDDPFAMLRSDSPKVTEGEDEASTEGDKLTPPPAAMASTEMNSFPTVAEPERDSYGDPASYQQPHPWQGNATTSGPQPEAYPQEYGSYAEQAGAMAGQAADQFSQQGQQAVDGVSEQAESFSQQGQQAVDDVTQQAESLSQQGQRAMDGFTQQAESLSQQASDALAEQQQTTDAMVGEFQEAAGGVREQVDAVSRQLSEGVTQETQQNLNDLANQAQEAVEEFTGRAGNAAEEYLQQAPEAVDSVVGQANDFVNEQMQRAGQYTQQSADAVQDTIENAAQGANPFRTSGSNPQESPLSAFEPPATTQPVDMGQTTGSPEWSNTGTSREPSVAIAEPPAQMTQPSSRRAPTAAPAVPMETNPSNTGYGQPQPSTPASRRSADGFGQPPASFDASAFEPPAESAPSYTPPNERAVPPVVATTPSPSYSTPTTPAARTTPPPVAQTPTGAGGTGNFSSNETTYTVQANDNYWLISEKLYGTGAYFKALFEHNRDRYPRANRLKVGDQIRTPPVEVLQQTYPKLCPRPRSASSPLGASSGRAPASRMPVGSGRTYVVQQGDTLYDIARYELGEANRWYEIRQLNRDVLGDEADRLQPGVELRMPSTDVASRSPATLNR